MCSRVTQIKEDLGMMDSIQSIAFQTRAWNKTKKWVFAILLRVEHVWSSIPNQHMRQPLLRRSGRRPRWPSPELDSMLLIGVKRSSTIVGSQTLEALILAQQSLQDWSGKSKASLDVQIARSKDHSSVATVIWPLSSCAWICAFPMVLSVQNAMLGTL